MENLLFLGVPILKHFRVSFSKPATKHKGKVVETTAAAATSSPGPVDLLGSILQGQNKLHLHSKDITIQKDGEYKARTLLTCSAILCDNHGSYILPCLSVSPSACLFCCIDNRIIEMSLEYGEQVCVTS